MRKKAMLWVGVVALCVAIVIGFAYSRKPKSRKENGVELLSFSVGDRLEGYTVEDESGTKLDISEVGNKKNRLLIFAWDKCGDCIREYDSYRLLLPLFESEKLSISFVWDDVIPKDALQEMGIKKGHSYSAKNQVKFTDWVPSYMLIDEQNTIVMKETDLSIVIDTISQRFPAKESGIADVFSEKYVLVGVDRCQSCKTFYETLLASKQPFRYLLEGEVNSSFYEEAKNVYHDQHKIVTAALGIQQYPALLQIGEDGSITILDEIPQSLQ